MKLERETFNKSNPQHQLKKSYTTPQLTVYGVAKEITTRTQGGGVDGILGGVVIGGT